MRLTLWGNFADPVNTRRAPGGVRGEARRPGPASADGRRGRGATPLPNSGPGLSGAGAPARSMPRPDTCAPNAGFAPRRAAESRRRAPCGAQAPGRDRPARRPAAVVALVAVAALFALAAPAQAQTEPVWSTTMTVGEHLAGLQGILTTHSSNPELARWTPDSFDLSGVLTYSEVTELHCQGSVGQRFTVLDFQRLDPGLSGVRRLYILEVAGETLPLDEVVDSLVLAILCFSPRYVAGFANATSLNEPPISRPRWPKAPTCRCACAPRRRSAREGPPSSPPPATRP